MSDPCPRCTGRDGAHFASCFLAQAWSRFMGDAYPWSPPAPDIAALVAAAVDERLAIVERSVDAVADMVAAEPPAQQQAVEQPAPEPKAKQTHGLGVIPPGTRQALEAWADVNLRRNDDEDGWTPLVYLFDAWAATVDNPPHPVVGKRYLAMLLTERGIEQRNRNQRHPKKTRVSEYRVTLLSAPVPESVPAPEPTPEPAAAVEPEAAPIPEPTPAPEPQRGATAPEPDARRVGQEKATATVTASAIGPFTEFAELHLGPADPEHFVPAPVISSLYEGWAQAAGKPPLSVRKVGLAMGALGYRRQQARKFINGSKPILYYGVRLLSKDEEVVEPDKPVPAPPREGTTAAIRASMERAKEARRLAAQAEPEPAPEPEPEVLNGKTSAWHKPPTAGANVPELTLEQLAAEHAAMPVKERPDGFVVRPGDEKLSEDGRALTNALLDLHAGWQYRPVGPGQKKSHLVAPDGQRFVMATSFGGGRGSGRIGDNRQLRAYLSRTGWLNTASSPASSVHVPAKGGGVTIIRADGSVRDLHDDIAISEADPGADPLTPEELEQGVFDLYEDVKAGLPSAYPFIYHPNVLALAGLNKGEIEGAIRSPEFVEVRPETKGKGYPVFGFQRGDVRAILGFRDKSQPAIIAAYWTTLMAHDTYRVERSGKAGGSKAATGLPSNPGASLKRLRNLGADVVENGKTAAVKYRGQELGQVTCGIGVPKLQVQTDYQRCLRKMHAIDQREAVPV